MGVIHSALCTITFCMERVMVCFACACILICLMFIMVVLTMYAVSVGYHYSQEELTNASHLASKGDERLGRANEPEGDKRTEFVHLVVTQPVEIRPVVAGGASDFIDETRRHGSAQGKSVKISSKNRVKQTISLPKFRPVESLRSKRNERADQIMNNNNFKNDSQNNLTYPLAG